MSAFSNRPDVGENVSHASVFSSSREVLRALLMWYAMRKILNEKRKEQHWRGRNVRKDIDMLKEFFRKHIGATWAAATRPDATLRVTHGADRAARKPWKDIATVMDRRGQAAPHSYIEAS